MQRNNLWPIWRLISFTVLLFSLMSGIFSSVIRAAETPPFDLSNKEAIEKGHQLFNQTCSGGYCHGRDAGPGVRGPRLSGRDDLKADYVHRVISNGIPRTIMRGFKDRLSEEEMWQLTAFIMSTQKGAQPSQSQSSSPSTTGTGSSAKPQPSSSPGGQTSPTTSQPSPSPSEEGTRSPQPQQSPSQPETKSKEAN